MGIKNDSEDKLMSRLVDSVKEISELYGCKGVFKNTHGDLVRRIKLLSPLFEKLRDGNVKLREEEARGFEMLRIALDSAKEFLRSVNGGSKLYQVSYRDSFVDKFSHSTAEIEAALSQIPYDKLELSEVVREQVQLLHSQFKRAKGKQDEFDPQLDRDIAAAQDVEEPDPKVIKRLSQELQLSTIDDLKKESHAIHEYFLLRDEEPGECFKSMSLLLKRLVDSATMESSEADTFADNKIMLRHRSPVIPDDFRCPISLELMKDPVIVSTGQTYERSCIQKWLDTGHKTCPKTQQTLLHTGLTPNYVLKSLIALWCESNGIELPKSQGGCRNPSEIKIQRDSGKNPLDTALGTTAMCELPPYPPIDPTSYDLIVVGTGLAESLISAAASSAGKSVLHLDPNPFYGSHFSSLSLSDLSSFLQSHSICPSPSPSSPHEPNGFIVVDLMIRPLYSSVEISNFAPQILEEHSRKFSIDVCGPRALFCADKSIDLMLKSRSNHYVEFRSIDATFVWDKGGELRSVPDSRAAIFKDKSLTLMEKNQLMKFFKLVQGHMGSASQSDEASRISEEDMETPFVEFLGKMRLPPKIKSIVLYAIAMLDYDQDYTETDRSLLKTRDGIDRLAVYSSSVGRFSNALGALIYPVYGQGELPQAFCRRAAVKGCLYVLRMPVTALLLDKITRQYKGIKLASGQEIFSEKLILDPSIAAPLSSVSSLSDQLRETLQVLAPKVSTRKVARGICIIRGSVKDDITNLLVVFPPSTLFPEQVTAIRVLQIGSSLAVCPAGMHVLYLSTLCDDSEHGKKLLHAAMDVLVAMPDSGDLGNDSEVQNDTSERKPVALWRALYVQELVKGEIGVISSLAMPDGNLNYNEMVESAVKIYENLFESEELFQEMASPENSEEADDEMNDE